MLVHRHGAAAWPTRRASTLTEILVVISLITGLTGLAFYGLTPARQFSDRLQADASQAIERAKANALERRIVTSTSGASGANPLAGFGGQFQRLGKSMKYLGSGRPSASTRGLLGGLFQSAAALELDVPGRYHFTSAPAVAPSMDWMNGHFTGIAIVPPVWRTDYTPADVFKLHSNPGADCVIFMDFNGHVTAAGNPWNALVNGGNPITALPWSMDAARGAFSALELDRIITLWRMVAEDFMPFNVDVTTEDPGVAALQYTGVGDTMWGMRVVIGPQPAVSNPAPWAGAGGIAFVGSFKSGIDTVCWVFNGDSVPDPETSLPTSVSHEVGHTLGLGHDGTLVPPSAYYSGHGAGSVSWGPIMGASFGMNLDQWSRNTYPGADNPEDDLAIIGNVGVNGFTFRPDDHGNTPSSATPLNGQLQQTLDTTYGIIEQNTDVDCFVFYANPGPIDIKVDQLFVGPNLDIKADLYDSAGNLVSSSNPLDELYAAFNLSLPKGGAYYLKVSGTGRPGATGYSNYGSLGSYEISGKVVPYLPPNLIRVLNPTRWTYDAESQTSSGYLSVINTGSRSISGTFAINMIMPDASIQVLSPSGTQTGNYFAIDITGTLVPNQPIRYQFRITNPNRITLPTGYNTFSATVQYQP